MKPHGRSCRYLDHPLPLSVPGDAELLPLGLWISQPLGKRRLSLAFLARTPLRSWLTPRCGIIQSSIQAQAGDDRDGLPQSGCTSQQFQDGIAVVCYLLWLLLNIHS